MATMDRRSFMVLLSTGGFLADAAAQNRADHYGVRANFNWQAQGILLDPANLPILGSKGNYVIENEGLLRGARNTALIQIEKYSIHSLQSRIRDTLAGMTSYVTQAFGKDAPLTAGRLASLLLPISAAEGSDSAVFSPRLDYQLDLGTDQEKPIITRQLGANARAIFEANYSAQVMFDALLRGGVNSSECSQVLQMASKGKIDGGRLTAFEIGREDSGASFAAFYFLDATTAARVAKDLGGDAKAIFDKKTKNDAVILYDASLMIEGILKDHPNILTNPPAYNKQIRKPLEDVISSLGNDSQTAEIKNSLQLIVNLSALDKTNLTIAATQSRRAFDLMNQLNQFNQTVDKEPLKPEIMDTVRRVNERLENLALQGKPTVGPVILSPSFHSDPSATPMGPNQPSPVPPPGGPMQYQRLGGPAPKAGL